MPIVRAFPTLPTMASLPLFSPSSPSFMPRDGATFTPSRPTPRAPAPVARIAAPFAAPPAARPITHGPSLPDGTPPSTVASDGSTESATGGATVARRGVAPASPTAATVLRTEAALREAGLAGRFWRGDALSTSSSPAVPSGFRALDEELPNGGWPSRCLTELLLSHVGVGEIRFLASTLAALTQAGREVVLLGPPHIPDPTGWEQLGIDMRRVLIVRTPQPADRLWALEQSLKSAAFGALVAWLPEEKTLARNDALRRLQLAAASANGLTFLMRPAAAQFHASPAPLRLTLSPGRVDGPRRTLSVRLLKRRGPVLAQPLTLLLPEVHLGMKAFSGVDAEQAITATPYATSGIAGRTPTMTSGVGARAALFAATRATRVASTESAASVTPVVDPATADLFGGRVDFRANPRGTTAPVAVPRAASRAVSFDPTPVASDALAGALLSDARA